MIAKILSSFMALVVWPVCGWTAPSDGGPASAAAGVSAWGMALLAVLAVIALISWFMRKFGGFNKEAVGQLQIVSTLPLGTREKIVLLKTGGKQLVLAVTPGKIETLHVLDAVELPAKMPAEPSFAQKLMQTIAANSAAGH